jgi:hypothetical protein
MLTKFEGILEMMAPEQGAAESFPWETQGLPAQVPFMITQAQKAKLRKKRFEDDRICQMTPEKAHQLLTLRPLVQLAT